MEENNRKPIKAKITYEVNEYRDSDSNEFNHYEYDDGYDNQTQSEDNTFELEYALPESNDEFIEALERWSDFIPDEMTKNDFEEGFGMMQYGEEYIDEEEDMAEFATPPNHDDNINTSIPQKIVIYFDDGSEEEIVITNQEDTLRRVLDVLQ
jgi:hypothetical protein